MTARLEGAGVARRLRQAFTILVIVGSVGGTAVVLLGYNPFAAQKSRVYADFDDANAIARKGVNYLADVRIAGVPVGRVKGLERVGDDARLELEIDDPAIARGIREDATAELRPRTPFEGNSFVDLHPGSRSAPPLEGPIRKSHTRNYVRLLEALSFARPQTREHAQRVAAESARVLGPDAQDGLQRAFKAMPQLTRDLGPGLRALGGPNDDDLINSVRGLAATFSSVAERESSVTPFLRGGETTFEALNTDGGQPLSDLLRTLPPTLESLRRGARALESILDRVDPFVRDMRPGLAQLTPAMREVRPLLREAQPALTHVIPFIRNLRPALRSGARSTPAAQRLLRATVPTSKLLNSSLLPWMFRQTPVGLPAYLALLGTLQGGAGWGSPFQTPEDSQQPFQQGAGHFIHFEGYFYSSGPSGGMLVECDQLLAPAIIDAFRKAGKCRG